MAVLLRGRQDGSTSSASSITLTSFDSESGVVRPDTVLVVAVGCRNASTAPTIDDVTFNAVSLTKSDGTIHTVSGTDVRAEIWYMTNPSGTANIIASFSASVSDAWISAAILDGAVEQAQEATNTATDATSPVGPHSITTVTDGAFIFDCCVKGGNNNAATTTETDQTGEGDAQTANGRLSTSTRQAGDNGSYTMGWTQASITESAHVLTAWEDAGAWISNFVSALTQGNEDASTVDNAAQIGNDTTTNYGISSPTSDWTRVWRITDNASKGALIFPQLADNQSAPSSNHIIFGLWLYFDDTTPGTEFIFFGVGDNGLDLAGPANRQLVLYLETDGDVRADSSSGGTIGTATTPFIDDTWHRVEIRILPGSSSDAELQMWVDGTSVLNLTGFSFAQSSHTFYDYFGVQGYSAETGDVYLYFAGAYCMINSTAASDRLDSDFEVIGPYQDSAATGTTMDNGDALDWDSAATVANFNEIPFSDETGSNRSGYSGTLAGSLHYNGGARPGPSGDSRIDSDAAIKAWKGTFRMQRANGSGTVHTIYMGDDSGTWSSGFDSQTLALTASAVNYYFVTNDSTNMPTSTDYFSLGFGKDGGGRQIHAHEMAAFVLHVPAAGVVAGHGLLLSHTRNRLVLVMQRIKVTIEELLGSASDVFRQLRLR